MEDFVSVFSDLLDDTLNFRDCLIARLLSIAFWLVLGASLALKQWYLLPRLEHYYKRTRAERTRVRKRRLRDTLNDPVLALQMEERLLKRNDIQGDRQKLLQAMQQLREMTEGNSTSSTEVGGCGDNDANDNDDPFKGQEKKEAADAILKATICMSIVLFFPIPGIFVMELARQFIVKYDSCTEFGGSLVGGWLSCAMFCLIHLIHSYKMIPKAKRGHSTKVKISEKDHSPAGAAAKDTFSIFSSNTNSERLGQSDMEQPFLPQEKETTESFH